MILNLSSEADTEIRALLGYAPELVITWDQLATDLRAHSNQVAVQSLRDKHNEDRGLFNKMVPLR